MYVESSAPLRLVMVQTPSKELDDIVRRRKRPRLGANPSERSSTEWIERVRFGMADCWAQTAVQ